jgi:class 3 adenylate cyclase
VHSTDIAAAVGPERLREIMAELADRCAAVVKRYGGTVDKFTRCAACWGTDTYARGGLACPDQVDRQRLELAVELLSDVGKYAENTIVADYMRRGQPLAIW